MRSHANWRRFGPLSILLLLATCQAGLAQKPAARPAGDSAALAKAGREYLAALERGDSKQIAAFWSADGTYVDAAGHSYTVRELFGADGTAAGSPRPTFAVKNVQVRFVSNDVALEEGECETESPGAGAAQWGRFCALWVRQNNAWKLNHLQEWRLGEKPEAPELSILDPLVGQWSGEAGSVSMRVSAKWNSSKSFLHREVTTQQDGKPSHSASQEIGWDGASQSIKSWTFSSDGSHGEGTWSQVGNMWLVVTTRILPDGGSVTITHAYKFPDKNTILVRSIGGPDALDAASKFEIKLKREPSGK